MFHLIIFIQLSVSNSRSYSLGYPSISNENHAITFITRYLSIFLILKFTHLSFYFISFISIHVLITTNIQKYIIRKCINIDIKVRFLLFELQLRLFSNSDFDLTVYIIFIMISNVCGVPSITKFKYQRCVIWSLTM